jgi:hypothetical protein
MAAEMSLHRAFGPEINRISQGAARDFVVAEEVPHKENSLGVVDASIQVGNQANVLRRHDQ